MWNSLSTTVYTNTYKGKNNSKGKLIITALQGNKIINIYIQITAILACQNFALRHIKGSRVLRTEASSWPSVL